jgi:hypothetical protein
MSHAARTLTAILGSMTVLLLSGPAEAKNIFEIIFGPPLGSQARRTHPSRHVGRGPHSHHTVATKLPPRVVRGSSRQRNARLIRPHQAVAAAPVKIPRVQHDAKQAQIMPNAELVEIILSDPTLRRGDVIEFPDGPRVYRGNGRFSAHKVSDFEQVREAGLIDLAHSGGVLPNSGASRPDAAKSNSRQPLPSAGLPADVTDTSSVVRGR